MPEFNLDIDNFLGAVKHNGTWRLFHDERHMWIVDYHIYCDVFKVDIDLHTGRRQNLLRLGSDNADAFFAELDIELPLEQFATLAPKPELTYVVNLDDKVFVDGNPELIITIDRYVTQDWLSEYDNTYYYLPNALRKMWLTKVHIGDAQWAIHYEAAVGAIKYDGDWRLFYEMDPMWILDFRAAIVKSKPDYFTSPIYSDWRRDLPLIDENNAETYIEMLKPYELSHDEVKGLSFSGYIGYVQPQLTYIVDFDNRHYVDGQDYWPHLYKPQVFVPDGWSFEIANPLDHVPPEIRGLWGVDK